MALTPREKKIAKLKDSADLFLFTEIERIEKNIPDFKDILKDVRGIDGYTPIKNVDYFDGYTPIKGLDYFDGKDGSTPSTSTLLELIKPLIPKAINGKDGLDYVITDKDYQSIAKLVEVNIPEIQEIEIPEEVTSLIEALDEIDDNRILYKRNGRIESISLNDLPVQRGNRILGSGASSLDGLSDVDTSNLVKDNSGRYVLGTGGLLNRIVIQSADDFGDTIDSNKEYFIDGAIDLGTKEIIVPTGGITIGGFGYDISLLYSSEDNHTIFKNADGSYSGNVTINNVNLYSTGSNSKIFDLDNDSNFGAVELNTVNLGTFSGNTTSIGNISNYRQFRTSNFAAIRYVDGFTFSGSMSGIAINDSIILAPLAGSTFVNAGVGLDITDSFSSNMNALSLSGNMVWSDISNSNFSDDGLADFSKLRLGGDDPLPNITADDTRAFFRQCRGIDNTFISSSWEITAETPTSIAAANTPVKLAGTTTNVIGSWFESGGNNRLTYIGLREVKVDINAVIALSSSNTETFRVIVRQWDDSEGVFIDLTKGRIETALKILGDRLGDRSFLSVATIDTNDYIEVWIENLANTNDPTGQIESVLIVTERQV